MGYGHRLRGLSRQITKSPGFPGDFSCASLFSDKLFDSGPDDLSPISDGGILFLHEERTGVDGVGGRTGVYPCPVGVHVPLIDVFRAGKNEKGF